MCVSEALKAPGAGLCALRVQANVKGREKSLERLKWSFQEFRVKELTWCRSKSASAPGTSLANSSDET